MDFKHFQIHHLVQEGIDAQGFTEPTPVQARVIPEALKGRDIRACAQTGTGKTVAFVIPILNQLIQDPHSQSLVIVPTRELGAQVHKVFTQLGKSMKVKCVLLLGGMKVGRQIRDIQKGVEVIVATPGRLKDHLERKTLTLQNVKTLVLDEADRMLDMGFLPDIKRILSHFHKHRQTLLFSATFPAAIQHLAARLQTQPVTINLAPSMPASTVEQKVYSIIQSQKTALLTALIEKEQPTSAIIFCRTKRRVDRLMHSLRKTGISIGSVHSDKSQFQRNRAIRDFSKRHIRILVATDIAARGLDIKDVSHVINYDVPVNPEDYVHRIGRTGRAKASGLAITLVCPEEETHIRAIEKLIRNRLERSELAGFVPDPNAPKSAPLPKPHDNGGQHHGNRPHSPHQNQNAHRGPKRNKKRFWNKRRHH